MCLTPYCENADVIALLSCAGMELRMFLVYTESSTTTIGVEGLAQLGRVIIFRVFGGFFPRTLYYFYRRVMMFGRLLMAKNRCRDI